MGRGQISLFDKIFTTPPPTDQEKKARQTIRRNELLAHRYYYFAQIRLLRFDHCLIELEKENFLSSETIIVILGEVRETISNLAASKLTRKELNWKYPWLDWTS